MPAADPGRLPGAGGRVHVGSLEITGKGKIERVRFRGGRLWVLAKNPRRVEVFDVSDPAAPVRVGEISGPDIDEMQAVYQGTRRLAFYGNRVSAYRLEPVVP